MRNASTKKGEGGRPNLVFDMELYYVNQVTKFAKEDILQHNYSS